MLLKQHADTTYRRLRRSIGYLGIALPILLVLASLNPSYVKLQPSISHYYYTNVREVFTGILCAVGLFLVRYKGLGNTKWWLNDNLLTNIAGLMAFGVAFVPTNPERLYQKIYTIIPSHADYLGWLHFGFAGTLFVIFAVLSLLVFTQGQERDPGIPVSMLDENHIYTFCGIIIIICIILIPISSGYFPYSTLVFEAIALFAFGSSWLIKGRALGDTGTIGEKIYGERH
jgi:hypothetical protein